MPLTLEPGTRIDRFGDESGSFASPLGTPFEARSLPPEFQTSQPYFQYEVVAPMSVMSGQARPWFGASGYGMQYELPGFRQ